MILCFNDKIKTFYKKNKKNYSFNQEQIQNLMPSCNDITCKCPKCKAKSNFSYHGSYSRNITFICKENTYDFKVTVSRVICNSCGSTHALLPDFIVPYRITSRGSILYIVSTAMSTSVLKTAEKFNISFQQIYAFIALVLSFYAYADSLNKQLNLSNNFNKKYYVLNCVTFCDVNFNINYFKHNKWIFLMKAFQNKTSPPYVQMDVSGSPHNF